MGRGLNGLAKIVQFVKHTINHYCSTSTCLPVKTVTESLKVGNVVLGLLVNQGVDIPDQSDTLEYY